MEINNLHHMRLNFGFSSVKSMAFISFKIVIDKFLLGIND